MDRIMLAIAVVVACAFFAIGINFALFYLTP